MPRKPLPPAKEPAYPTADEAEAKVLEMQEKLGIKKKKAKRGSKLPQASNELWPGESTDLGGFGVT